MRMRDHPTHSLGQVREVRRPRRDQDLFQHSLWVRVQPRRNRPGCPAVEQPPSSSHRQWRRRSSPYRHRRERCPEVEQQPRASHHRYSSQRNSQLCRQQSLRNPPQYFQLRRRVRHRSADLNTPKLPEQRRRQSQRAARRRCLLLRCSFRDRSADLITPNDLTQRSSHRSSSQRSRQIPVQCRTLQCHPVQF